MQETKKYFIFLFLNLFDKEMHFKLSFKQLLCNNFEPSAKKQIVRKNI